MQTSTSTLPTPAPEPLVRPAATPRRDLKASYRAWSRVAATTNVRHITLAELAERCRELVEGGAITADDHALLSAAPDAGAGAGGDPPPPIGIRVAPDRPRDYLLFWQHQLAIQKSNYAPPAHLERTQRILDILNYLESLRTTAA